MLLNKRFHVRIIIVPLPWVAKHCLTSSQSWSISPEVWPTPIRVVRHRSSFGQSCLSPAHNSGRCRATIVDLGPMLVDAKQLLVELGRIRPSKPSPSLAAEKGRLWSKVSEIWTRVDPNSTVGLISAQIGPESWAQVNRLSKKSACGPRSCAGVVPECWLSNMARTLKRVCKPCTRVFRNLRLREAPRANEALPWHQVVSRFAFLLSRPPRGPIKG